MRPTASRLTVSAHQRGMGRKHDHHPRRGVGGERARGEQRLRCEVGRYSGAQTLVTSKSGSNTIHGSLFIDIHRPGLNAYQHRLTFAGNSSNPREIRHASISMVAAWVVPSGRTRCSGSSRMRHRQTIRLPRDRAGTTRRRLTHSDPGKHLLEVSDISGSRGTSTGIIPSTCAGIGLVEGVNCNTIAGQGLNIGSPLNPALYPLGTQDPTATGTSVNPGVGGGLSNVADIANFAVTSPYSSYYTQYNGRLDADVTKKDHVAFAIYWVPQGSTDYNGGSRAYNLFHHDQINDAFSVIWNHTFTPTFLNEARANAAGWRWNEIADNPQAPVGLPQDNSRSIRVDHTQSVRVCAGQHSQPMDLRLQGCSDQDCWAARPSSSALTTPTCIT